MTGSYTHNMTQGSPTKLLLKFSFPMFIGNLFQQFYNMVDAIIVGNYEGANALAAVGATGALTFFFASLMFGLAAGIGVIVSQYYGAEDERYVIKTIANAFYILTAAAIVMGTIGVITARPILEFLKTPPLIIDGATIYLKTVSLGMVAIAAFNGVSAILRALGDAKTPLIFLVIACIINVVLDLIFVIVCGWSVFGVALATIIAQITAAIGCMIYALVKVPYFRIPKEYRGIDMEIVKKCIRLGIPVALQNAMISVSCIVLQRVANGYGEVTVAAYTATGRVEQLVHQPYTSLGAALATYSGQNMGAGRKDRVKKGFWSSTIMIAIFSAIMLPVTYLFGEDIIRLFVDDAEVVSMGARALRITSWFYFPLGMIYTTRNILNGAGDVTYAMINGIMEVSGRVGLAVPLTRIPVIGVWGIWLTGGLTWLAAGVVGCLRYASGVWEKKSLIKPEDDSKA